MLWLVPALALLVAGLQVARVVTVDQSSWIGGGFGMFATYDYDDTRVVVAWWQTPDGPVVAAFDGVRADDVLRARVVPSEANALRIAEDIVAGGVAADATALVVEVRGRELDDDVLSFPVLVHVEVGW